MAEVPEFVYLITVDTEWPVSAIAVDNGGIIAAQVEREVERRRSSANVWYPQQVHVWKARLADVVEVDLMPSAVVGPSLRERAEGDHPDNASPEGRE